MNPALPSLLLSIPRIVLGALLIALNTIFHATPLLLPALLKLLVPLAAFRTFVSRVLIGLAESWIAVNSWLMGTLAGVVLNVDGLEGLQRRGWYLVICNHQSWVDIPVLQWVFNRRIPFLKFFLKSQLIWVPVLGLAWWALDFPFMKRYSKDQLKRNPHWRGKDTEATRRACEKFRDLPVSIMNFVEGTRFTEDKHRRLQSPYAHLLHPRAGGIAFVLGAMGEMIDAVVDVSIHYPGGRPTVVDLLAGRVRRVTVKVDVVPVPAHLIGGDYENDRAFRVLFQNWLNQRWQAKDAFLREASGGTPPAGPEAS
jgi:1-acyl-sn-glycerol-3-phosphate acyltransferase